VHKNAVRGWTWKKTAPVQNYLGVSLTSLISWTIHTYVKGSISLQLFHSFIASILYYACEILGFGYEVQKPKENKIMLFMLS
jgi:hypothetical protein